MIFSVILWQVVGGFFCCFFAYCANADGWELANPYWVYQYNKSVNWFGAAVLALMYTAICPAGALCYWFYKLCTIGR